jgi:bifunctional N-acetylglucosamine-1-phosphate-uridyltransferase/glucosamine-1-phosphate-acetyltransferase GlmU-like protein
MSRLLVIPAAGLGTRLGSSTPKALVRVNGRPMLDYLRDLYRPHVTHTVVVSHPSFSKQVREWAAASGDTDVVEQTNPTGMLDAILCAMPAVTRRRPDSIWITWCDQIGVLPKTVDRLAEESSLTPSPALAMPTVRRPDPYIHFDRDDGLIVHVRQRREGDDMPAEGESDMGLFALRRETFLEDLQEYARSPAIGASTRERLFLPFIPWMSARGDVVTFPCTDPMEAIGINTPDELRAIERWLQERTR